MGQLKGLWPWAHAVLRGNMKRITSWLESVHIVSRATSAYTKFIKCHTSIKSCASPLYEVFLNVRSPDAGTDL